MFKWLGIMKNFWFSAIISDINDSDFEKFNSSLLLLIVIYLKWLNIYIKIIMINFVLKLKTGEVDYFEKYH